MASPSKLDLLTNYSSMIISGGAGLLLPVLVGIFYGASGLGTFNVVFSLYIILSQVAAFGIHVSLLKYLTEACGKAEEERLLIHSAFAAVVPLALFTTLVLCFVAPAISWVYSSKAIETGILWASAGLFFFACNKVQLACFNALSKFQHYAFFSSARFLLLLLALVIYKASNGPVAQLPAIFPLAEGVLCLLMLFYLRKYFVQSSCPSQVLLWVKKHVSFGARAFTGNILLDINSRIDILCLGYFADARTVGIYSMAAVIAEAAYQIPIVARTVYSPQIIMALYNKHFTSLHQLAVKLRRLLWAGMGVASVIGVTLYPLCIPIITGIPEYADGTLYLGILLAGVVIAAGYAPFSLMLAAGGFPGRQSAMVLCLVLFNLVTTCLAVPLLGAAGAACTTASTYVLSIFALKFQVRRYLQFSL